MITLLLSFERQMGTLKSISMKGDSVIITFAKVSLNLLFLSIRGIRYATANEKVRIKLISACSSDIQRTQEGTYETIIPFVFLVFFNIEIFGFMLWALY